MNVCREPETLSTKCYTNPSICGFSVVFNFSAGIFKARMVTRIYKKSYTAGVSVFVLLFTTDPGIFGPVTEPLSVPQFPQLQNEGINCICSTVGKNEMNNLSGTYKISAHFQNKDRQMSICVHLLKNINLSVLKAFSSDKVQSL